VYSDDDDDDDKNPQTDGYGRNVWDQKAIKGRNNDDRKWKELKWKNSKQGQISVKSVWRDIGAESF